MFPLYCHICVLLLLYMCPHTTMCAVFLAYCCIGVCTYCYVCVLILVPATSWGVYRHSLHLCPHTASTAAYLASAYVYYCYISSASAYCCCRICSTCILALTRWGVSSALGFAGGTKKPAVEKVLRIAISAYISAYFYALGSSGGHREVGR